MAILNRCLASLRIFGDDLVPEELNRLFGHACTKGWVKGHKFSSVSGRDIEKKSGVWILDAEESETADFDSQVSQLLNYTNLELSQWNSLSTKFEVDIFCGWFMKASNEGIGISPQTLLMLGERGIAVSIDIYSPTVDEP